MTQQNIRDTVDAMTDQSRGFSLLDLGFSDVGVDDGWQACGGGVQLDNATTGCAPFCESFHAADGTPLLNRSKFQSLEAMVAYGHGKKVTMGWYDNNCMCGDEYTKRANATWRQLCNEGDIKLLLDAGFDGVKIVSVHLLSDHSILSDRHVTQPVSFNLQCVLPAGQLRRRHRP